MANKPKTKVSPQAAGRVRNNKKDQMKSRTYRADDGAQGMSAPTSKNNPHLFFPDSAILQLTPAQRKKASRMIGSGQADGLTSQIRRAVRNKTPGGRSKK